MTQVHDLKGMKCLFVSYFYPPAAGTGLPGTMRSVKFIRNLVNAQIHVLTIDQDCYNKSVKLDTRTSLPVKNETIYRAGIFDFFNFILNFRSRVRGFPLRKTKLTEKGSTVFVSSTCSVGQASSTGGKGFLQRIKDFVYNLCYFPDQASTWIVRAFFWAAKLLFSTRSM